MSTTAVYVVHLMCVSTHINYLPDGQGDPIQRLGAMIANELRNDLCRIAERYYEGYELASNGVYTKDFVLQADKNWHREMAVHGEYCWVRKITSEDGGDEVFDSADSVLIVRPNDVVEVSTDFGADVFAGKHGAVIGDAEAELRNEAFEIVFAELKREYGRRHSSPYPDLLPETIVDALRNRNLLTATRADMTALTGEIIAAFATIK